jgi:hypothetical protein
MEVPMVSVTSLWLPVLLSAVIVYIASSIIHMVLTYHQSDLKPMPREDEVMGALRRFDIPPGDYALPHAGSMEAMKKPEFTEKMKAGPVVLMTVSPPGPCSMGKSLGLWFGYCLVTSLFAAYVAGRALSAGASYLEVFRFAGTTAFAGYALALLQNSIWYRRAWSTTLKQIFDGLIYALLTAGTFGWLWPR